MSLVGWAEWGLRICPGAYNGPFSYMIAGLLFIMAPGVRADGMRLSAIWALVAAFSIGSLLAGILIGASISTG